jgi:hypothetical protein
VLASSQILKLASLIKLNYWIFFRGKKIVRLFHEFLLPRFASGLPDFSWDNLPKREKYTNLPQTIPYGHKLY